MAKDDDSIKPIQDDGILEPLEALEIAMGASSISDAWVAMADKLSGAGFDPCAFAFARRSVEAPIGHPETKFWGTFVSDRFLEEMAAHPEVQKLSPVLQTLRRTARPTAFFGNEAEIKETSPDAAKYNGMIRNYGVEGRAMAPFHAPSADCLMVVGWWNFEDSNKAREHWYMFGGYFGLAATYFCQGILEAFNPLAAQPVEKLSARERECLLWAAAGRRTGEIAEILGLADATVNEYLNRAMKKLGAKTRAEACAKAVISGILSP